MNEHLQNLARRAGFIGTNFSNTVIGTDQETALKNFAELIVQECASLLPRDMTHGPDGRPLAQVFANHIGVK